MPEFQNRTLICSVLFIDIVEYSQKSIVEQGRLKDRFNAILSEALRGVAINDRIILDTGDGAAISFIGDPEDALFVATGLRDAIDNTAHSSDVKLLTRMGINLGPVRLVKDINGQPNIIGDGINVAQRVMTFAKPGQVLVSRSYYEVVSRLSEESSKLFSYEGARTDKHVREHEVYAVGSTPPTRQRGDLDAPVEWERGTPSAATSAADGSFGSTLRKPAVLSMLAAIAIIGTAVVLRDYREAHGPPKARPVETAAVKPAVIAPAPAQPGPPIRGLPPEPVDRRAPAGPEAGSSASQKSAAKEKAKARERAQSSDQGAPRTVHRTPEVAVTSTPATVSFAVAPWGEVHVDGKMHGVSPPLQELELSPGRHRIELKNSASQPHVVTVNAKSGERIRIKHKFD